MDFTEDTINAAYVISSCNAETIVVNEESYHHSFIISPEKLISDWPVEHVDQVSNEHLERIIACQPDIVILGCGINHPGILQSITRYFYANQVGIEIMSTAAACRTYNILIAENRNVTAALILENV